MQHSEAYYKELLSGFIRNTIITDQVKELYLFIEQEPESYERLMRDPDLIELIGQNADRSLVELQPAADQRIREHIQAHADRHVRDEEDTFSPWNVVPLPDRRRRWGWAVAAAVLIVGFTTVLIVSSRRRNSTPRQDVASQPLPFDVKAPQTNRAMITLANGQQVALDSINKGLLARQGNVRLVKLDDGRIAYQNASGGTIREVQYNTLYNPRGSKVIDMVLSDGSHVWLNAGSSVTYPVAFTGKERKVAITGEAYFEVLHDASKPFYVSKGNVEVKVLGTHFNVDAYDDEENIKVTLVQGSVKVLNTLATAGAASSDGQSNSLSGVMLSPGQQAAVAVTGSKEDKIRIIANPDLEAVMAWKDGLFNFNKVPLQDVMHQLARWYNVDVEYQGTVTAKTLGGEMQRDLNLSEVLDGLRDIGLHFRIEGKKVIVMP
jgi:transmembrane sensor